MGFPGPGSTAGGHLPPPKITTGESTSLTYDNNGFLTSVVPPAPGTTVTFTPDSAERIATSTDAVNGTLDYSYDALNRLTKVTYPDSSYEQIAYDRLDVASTRDRDGRVTHYTHDAARRLVGIQDPAGRLIQLAWCDCGALTALTDGAGHTTNWAYNFMDQLITKTYADGSKTSYGYDPTDGLLTSITDALNQQTAFTYNISNQLSGVSYSDTVNPTPNVLFSYEPLLGRLNAMQDGTGQTLFEYNPFAPGPGAGYLSKVQGPLKNSAVQYGYDASGRVTSVSVNGTAEDYTYNPYGQLSQVTNPLGSFQYSYDDAGRLAQVSLPNGAKTALSYYPSSQSGRLEQITHSGALGLLAQYGYSYDPAGQITSWTQQQGSNPLKTILPEYDLAGQLTGSAETVGSVTNDLSWAYDLAGNRTQSGFNGVTTAYTNNTLNQLTQINPESLQVQGYLNVSATVAVNGLTTTTRGTSNEFNVWTPATYGPQVLTITAQNGGVNAPLNQKYRVVNGQGLQYDLDGNLINDGKFVYSWDAANRLIQISTLAVSGNNPAHTSKFSYDGFDRMVEDQEYAGVDLQQDRKFIWDDTKIAEERDQHDNVMKRFYTQGEQVISGAIPGNYSYLRDQLGSIKTVLDANGNIASLVDYDPWGNLTQTAGDFTPDFGYAGYFEHYPSGLALTWFRGYSPLQGRWISRDPLPGVYGILENINQGLYGYVHNDPFSNMDEYGLLTANQLSQDLCAASGLVGGTAIGLATGGTEATLGKAVLGISIAALRNALLSRANGGQPVNPITTGLANVAIGQLLGNPLVPAFAAGFGGNLITRGCNALAGN